MTILRCTKYKRSIQVPCWPLEHTGAHDPFCVLSPLLLFDLRTAWKMNTICKLCKSLKICNKQMNHKSLWELCPRSFEFICYFLLVAKVMFLSATETVTIVSFRNHPTLLFLKRNRAEHLILAWDILASHATCSCSLLFLKFCFISKEVEYVTYRHIHLLRG